LGTQLESNSRAAALSLHALGVTSGLAAGAWLGAAEAPVKLVTIGLSPFLVSLAMVSGVFVARWTVPTLMKGTGYVFFDLREKPHLIVWAVLAGALWSVANTLTVFAIRDVGISVAFPIWNTNSLVGVFWGWFFFRELRGAGWQGWLKVVGGAVAIVAGATLLGYATAQHAGSVSHRATSGILAALGAGMLWGTMYIPYRKAYLSGMNPLSFVTVFTVGELVTISALALVFRGGVASLLDEVARARPVLFWLFLGGFCWVLGDLFQQYAAKYIGIGRGIPLSNTNQLWGLAWGALVFGELAGQSRSAQTMIIAGSIIMILGAVGISTSVAPASERGSRTLAMTRERDRYGLDLHNMEASQAGEDPLAKGVSARRWWDGLIVAAAVGIFIWMLVAGGMFLWKRTRFS
jgi:glucose uptake protein GlcU